MKHIKCLLPSAKSVLYFISVQTNKEAGDTYTLFTVKHVAEVFVGFGVFADKSEYPFIRLVICTEGYPVQLTVVLHILEKKTKRKHTNTRHSLFTHFMNVDTKSLLFSTQCLLSAELQVTGVGVSLHLLSHKETQVFSGLTFVLGSSIFTP